MAITVHIGPIGEVSKNEDHNIQLRIKQNDNSSSVASHSPFAKLQQSLSTQQPQLNTQSSIYNTSISNLQSSILSTSNTQSLSPTRSTTQEDTPPSSYLPATWLSLSTLTDSLSTCIPVNPFSHQTLLQLPVSVLNQNLPESDI